MKSLQSRTAGALLMLLGAAASAQPEAPTDNRTWLQLQATSATWRTQTRGDYTFGQQSTPSLQLESDVGLPQRATLAGIGFGRRIGQRWRI